jgi:hypothetical protein
MREKLIGLLYGILAPLSIIFAIVANPGGKNQFYFPFAGGIVRTSRLRGTAILAVVTGGTPVSQVKLYHYLPFAWHNQTHSNQLPLAERLSTPQPAYAAFRHKGKSGFAFSLRAPW